MLNIKLDVTSSTYLSNCDLINKYNFKSVYNTPKLKKIILDFNLLDFINATDLYNKEQTDSKIQIKASVIFYILNEVISYINFNKSLNSLKKLKISENNYSLKISIGEVSEINSFLFLFFIENWSKLMLEDFILFKKKNETFQKDFNLRNNKFVFSSIVPSSCFFELDTFLNKNIIGLNPKNFNIKVNFLFENPSKLKNSPLLIKNLPYFWISG